MKKLFTSVAIAALCLTAYAQDDVQKAAAAAAAAMYSAPATTAAPEIPSYWKQSVDFNLGFDQLALFSWAAGGNNTVKLLAGIDAKANYSKDLTTWSNRLQMDYGFLWSSDKKGLLQKNNDQIHLESSFAYKTAKDSKWSYSASFDFRSQFAPGYKDYSEVNGKWEGKQVSDALSPGYFKLSLGMSWVPADWFNLQISPLTSSIVVCTNELLRPSYGMKLIDPAKPESGYAGSLFQLGASATANVAVSINDVFKYETQLVLFYDYLYDYKAENTSKFPIRINWDNKISWQLARFFKVALNTWLIYDPIVIFKDNDQSVGQHKIQFKEFFSLSFTYTIASKK